MIILLVDDEKDTRTVARIALRQLGRFTVVEAASGPEALAAATSARPDAVILDVMMPGMDGPAVLSALRADPSTADLPVIFLTAKAMPDEVARLKALGVLAIYTKPFDPAVFARDVREALSPRTAGPEAAAAAARPASSGPEPEIDVAALARLEGLTSDTGADLLGDLIVLFAANTPDALARLRELTLDHPASADTIERLAHTLKSTALTLGAIGIADAARRIERLAREPKPAEITALVDQIAERLAPTVDRLRVERARVLGGTER